jgi:hypothetical protein
MRSLRTAIPELARKVLVDPVDSDFSREPGEAFPELPRAVLSMRVNQPIEGDRYQQQAALQDAEVNGVFAEVKRVDHLPREVVLHRPVVVEELAELGCLARREPARSRRAR